MPLPSSPPLSFSQVAAEFGGGLPEFLSDYLRGGPRVPATHTTSSTTVDFGTWSVYRFSAMTLGGGPDPNSVSDGWVLKDVSGFLTSHGIWSGGNYVGGSLGTVHNYSTGATTGFQFERGPLYSSDGEYFFYEIRSRGYEEVTTETTSNVNTGVPTSLPLSLSDLLGAQDY